MRIFGTACDNDNRLPICKIKVLRFENGETKHVLLLSGKRWGIFYHWIGKGKSGRAIYCRGDKCPPGDHRIKQDWRGYLPCCWYEEEQKLWIPAVLEVTAKLDSEWREVRDRGQVWIVGKKPAAKSSQMPLEALFLEARKETEQPHAFDILPTLLWTYGVSEMCLTSDNPMPVSVGMEAFKLESPPNSKPTSDNEHNEVARVPAGYLREKLRQAMNPKQPPPKAADG